MRNHIDEESNIKPEIDFCKEIEAEVNVYGNFIYKSESGNDAINLPFILAEYKEWLLVNNRIQ